jgi:hypothetical protein
MPETKINVRSPFVKKYQHADLISVLIELYIYSGTKTSDKGTAKYKLRKFPINNNDYVIIDYSEIIRDYVTPTSTTPLNSNKDYIKWIQIEEVIEKEYVPDCTDVSGFAVAQDGTVTLPVSSSSDTRITKFVFREDGDFIPASETTPARFAANTSGSPISRQLTAHIKIPSGFSGFQTDTKTCVLTADQPSS